MMSDKRVREGCGRCESEKLDVRQMRGGSCVEVRKRCLTCGYAWSEYNRGGG